MFITPADFEFFRWGGGKEQNERGGTDQTSLGRMNIYRGGTSLCVLGLGDGLGGGEEGGRGGGI